MINYKFRLPNVERILSCWTTSRPSVADSVAGRERDGPTKHLAIQPSTHESMTGSADLAHRAQHYRSPQDD